MNQLTGFRFMVASLALAALASGPASWGRSNPPPQPSQPQPAPTLPPVSQTGAIYRNTDCVLNDKGVAMTFECDLIASAPVPPSLDYTYDRQVIHRGAYNSADETGKGSCRKLFDTCVARRSELRLGGSALRACNELGNECRGCFNRSDIDFQSGPVGDGGGEVGGGAAN